MFSLIQNKHHTTPHHTSKFMSKEAWAPITPKYQNPAEHKELKKQLRPLISMYNCWFALITPKQLPQLCSSNPCASFERPFMLLHDFPFSV